MRELLPEGDDLRRAVRWISGHLQEDAASPLGPLIREATFKFDLSPKDGEFLLRFFSQKGGRMICRQN